MCSDTRVWTTHGCTTFVFVGHACTLWQNLVLSFVGGWLAFLRSNKMISVELFNTAAIDKVLGKVKHLGIWTEMVKCFHRVLFHVLRQLYDLRTIRVRKANEPQHRKPRVNSANLILRNEQVPSKICVCNVLQKKALALSLKHKKRDIKWIYSTSAICVKLKWFVSTRAIFAANLSIRTVQ